MKRDLRLLLAEVGKKMKQEPHQLASDFDHLSAALSKRHIHLSSSSLKKLWDVMTGKRKLSNEALDRLSLFAGFQDWKDLRDAFHGDVDASINYEDEPERR
ncbi:MAG: hypothetical protein I3J02_00785 [Prevotella sp.]|nr:hypothetical protein [Prevotella sp.]